MGRRENHQYEVFIGNFTKNEQNLRRFLRSLLPSWEGVDEVLQETALVLWRKIEHYDPSTEFIKWACVVARFEALAYRRKMARDRLVFREDLFKLIAEEAQDELEGASLERSNLQKCLSELPADQKRFVLLAYTPGVKVKELANQEGSSPGAFYMRLKRIRHQLLNCVERKLQNQ